MNAPPVRGQANAHDAVPSLWDDALLAAACVALDPVGIGGVLLRASAGAVRDDWVTHWRGLLAPSIPVRTVPIHVDDARLLGGVDLAGSLASGRLVREPGVLEQVAGGFAVLAMAERIDASTAGRIALALDGVDRAFAAIAFDEGGDEEHVHGSLTERLGIHLDLHRCSARASRDASSERIALYRDALESARERWSTTVVGDEVVAALCETAAAIGIDSSRPPLYAVRVARAVAALNGRGRAGDDDAAAAARLVLAPRARCLPPPADASDAAEEEADEEADNRPQPESAPSGADADSAHDDDAVSVPNDALDDVVLEATIAAIPAGLLARLAANARSDRTRAQGPGGAGAAVRSRVRGAPAGVRRGRPRAPERLALVATLRSAAPWQRVRRAERPDAATRVQVRADDLHTRRFRQRRATTTVFVVDASGSSALHRLAEAKGAVELLLADCYVRRDQVAVIAFRGQTAQLLLSPTRSLVRARRSLGGLPGGGGTPLALALDAARELVIASRRRGETVLTVFLTDGRANVARDGSGGRANAEADARDAARLFRAIGADALFIDTAPRPHPDVEALAAAMGASYHPLPHANAQDLSAIVQRRSTSTRDDRTRASR